MGLSGCASRYLSGDLELNSGIYGLINLIQQLPPALPVLCFFITVSLLILLKDWRASILVLLVQYLVLGTVLAQLVVVEMAAIKLMVGLFICPVLYLSARQTGWRQSPTLLPPDSQPFPQVGRVAAQLFPPGRTFRLLALLTLAVSAISLAQTYPISGVPLVVTMAVYWLTLTGMFILILSEEPLKVGQGVLTIITGFELWFTTLQNHLLLVGLWGAVNLMIALAIGYLMIVGGVNLEEDS